jgi:hypothetical protein
MSYHIIPVSAQEHNKAASLIPGSTPLHCPARRNNDDHHFLLRDCEAQSDYGPALSTSEPMSRRLGTDGAEPLKPVFPSKFAHD